MPMRPLNGIAPLASASAAKRACDLRVPLTTMSLEIALATVRSAMAQMGRPEEFGERRVRDEQFRNINPSLDSTYTQRVFRRPLYDRVFGGVCAGVARYFNTDAAVIRLITFLLVFFGTLSLWVYIILWIVMPSDEAVANFKK